MMTRPVRLQAYAAYVGGIVIGSFLIKSGWRRTYVSTLPIPTPPAQVRKPTFCTSQAFPEAPMSRISRCHLDMSEKVCVPMYARKIVHMRTRRPHAQQKMCTEY